MTVGTECSEERDVGKEETHHITSPSVLLSSLFLLGMDDESLPMPFCSSLPFVTSRHDCKEWSEVGERQRRVNDV